MTRRSLRPLKMIGMWLALATALILAACGGKTAGAPAIPTASQTPAKLQAQAQTPTSGPGCTVASRSPTPGPTEQSLFPASKPGDWSKGPENAQVTIIEYSDFQ